MENRVLNTRVAGVTHEGRQGIIARLLGNEPCRIVPEPENPHDPNALAVHVATSHGIQHIGYIPRDIAAEIAPVLDGEAFMCTIAEITGGFMLQDGAEANLGVRLRIELPPDESVI